MAGCFFGAAGGFFVAAGGVAVVVAAAAGRGAGAAGRGAASGGSGVMILIGGIEAEVGKSAFVGLPVGIVGVISEAGAAALDGGAPQPGS